MAILPGSTLLGQPMIAHKCKRCGADLPVVLGETPDNCEEWGQQMIAKLRPPIDLNLWLGLRNHGMMCRILGTLQDELALMMETWGGGDETAMDRYRHRTDRPIASDDLS